MAKAEINNINSADVELQQTTKGMQQYLKIKKEHPGSLLLYRMGDFYETFFEDARTLSKELELTLTGREAGEIGRIPLAGIPVKASDGYIKRLIDKGIKVTVCDQLEDPKNLKYNEIVKRGVTRTITAGTIIENNYLEQSSNNYICAVFEEKGLYGFAYTDVSTGEFKVTQASLEMLMSELARIRPVEVVGPAIAQKIQPFQIVPEEKLELPDEIVSVYKCSKIPKRIFSENYAEGNLLHTLNIQSLDTLGYKNCALGYRAAGALIGYIRENLKEAFPRIDRIEHYELSEYVLMDCAARRNLELTETMREKSKYGSLFWAIDRTHTNMGTRLLKSWICQPLKNADAICHRHNTVEILISDNNARERLIELLDGMYDIQRIAVRLSTSSVLPRDFISLKNSLSILPDLDKILESCGLDIFHPLSVDIPKLSEYVSIIDKTILDNPSNILKEGGIIKDNVDETLDSLRNIMNNAEDWIKNFEEDQRSQTGIKNLKVGYNKVFGYYIEVTNSFLSRVPSNYVRKQTLTGSERFITEKLKQYEDKVLSSQSKVTELEYKIYSDFRSYSKEFVPLIKKAALLTAELDVLLSFATIAIESDYTKPEITDGSEFIVRNGRHPVLEKVLPLGTYVSNDLNLSENSSDNISKFMILTGPNMAGKSTYMRQNALIAILAQAGSYVPAEYVRLGIVDKIFTRVGASDDLSLGQSTFMVEMIETAYILNNATAKSLILIDEIGRGTSTYDGVAIAWAVAEYIAAVINARCIFATHYHELNVMSRTYPQIKNYRITVSDVNGKIEFLRKIIPGGASKSYGVHVAQMAGLPNSVVKRSQELMVKLQKDFSKDLSERKKTLQEDTVPQLSLF